MQELRARIAVLEAENAGLRGDNGCLRAAIASLSLDRVLQDAIETSRTLAVATRSLRGADARDDISDLHDLVAEGLNALLGGSDLDANRAALTASGP